jgi:hypothetical protein
MTVPGFSARTTTRSRRNRERGNSLLLAMIVMSALATLGSLTVVAVQGSLKGSTTDRSASIAMYAAESGGAAAMDFLRRNYNVFVGWSAYVQRNNLGIVPLGPPDLPSSGAQPGTTENAKLFSADQRAWYQVEIYNNLDDPGFSDFFIQDQDARVIIRATGHGPQSSVAVIEWEVMRADLTVIPPLSITPSVPLMVLSWRVVL